MIDLAKFKKRSEFIKAWNKREEEHEKAIEFYDKELHHLNLRLQEYEGIQTKDEKDAEFERFWKRHQCHGNKKTTKARYLKLSKKNKALIEIHHPKYVKATHKAAYPTRKYGEVYLSKEAWFDEIPQAIQNNGYTAPQPAVGRDSFVKRKPQARPEPIDPKVIEDRIAKLKGKRATHQKDNK